MPLRLETFCERLQRSSACLHPGGPHAMQTSGSPKPAGARVDELQSAASFADKGTCVLRFYPEAS